MKKIITLSILYLVAYVLFSACMPQPSFLKKLHFIDNSTIPKCNDARDSTGALYHAYIYEYLIIREMADKASKYYYVGNLKIVDSTIYFEYLNRSNPPDLDSLQSFSFAVNDIKKTEISNIRDNLNMLSIDMINEHSLVFIIDNEKFYDKIKKEN